MTIKLITRAQWGARPRESGSTSIAPEGVVIHYEGDGWKFPWDHSTCDDKVRNIQAYHMDVKGWSDIAYNYLACPHGYVFEGRGWDRRSSANGDTDVNYKYFAVQCMWGIRAGAKVPNALKTAARDAIDLLRSHWPHATRLLGHRDTNQTDCPGDELYAWVKAGCPRPGIVTSPGDDDLNAAEIYALPIPGQLPDDDGSIPSMSDGAGRGNYAYKQLFGNGAVNQRLIRMSETINEQATIINDLRAAVADLQALANKP